jgi:predicted  nucleic acid-binding Zn-ribbon protein
MSADDLLQVQRLDTSIDQIRHRLPRLPEVVAEGEAVAALDAWRQRDAALRHKIAGFEAAIEAAERANAEVTAKRDDLQRKLKTVIAPREAEALMHEIATLSAQRSALDDDELAAMDGLSATEEVLGEHAAAEAAVRERAEAAAAAASAARAAEEGRAAELAGERDALRAALPASLVRRYDEMRPQHGGVAVAALAGSRCDGCHLDISAAELDTIKAMPPDEMAECPNCGRMLVRVRA